MSEPVDAVIIGGDYGWHARRLWERSHNTYWSRPSWWSYVSSNDGDEFWATYVTRITRCLAVCEPPGLPAGTRHFPAGQPTHDAVSLANVRFCVLLCRGAFSTVWRWRRSQGGRTGWPERASPGIRSSTAFRQPADELIVNGGCGRSMRSMQAYLSPRLFPAAEVGMTYLGSLCHWSHALRADFRIPIAIDRRIRSNRARSSRRAGAARNRFERTRSGAVYPAKAVDRAPHPTPRPSIRCQAAWITSATMRSCEAGAPVPMPAHRRFSSPTGIADLDQATVDQVYALCPAEAVCDLRGTSTAGRSWKTAIVLSDAHWLTRIEPGIHWPAITVSGWRTAT